ncbi:MAG: hypothetical protein RJB39_716 [Candidatus Parcubacteria bacterium]|jgi:hypothetical protein
MISKKQKAFYISLVCLAVIVLGIWLFTNGSSTRGNSANNTNQSAVLQEKADAFNVTIEANIPKEKTIVSKEGDQAKFIDSDKNIINEFNFIFDEKATTE